LGRLVGDRGRWGIDECSKLFTQYFLSIQPILGLINRREATEYPLYDSRRDYLKALAKRHLDSLRRRDFLEGAAYVNGSWIASGERQVIVDPATKDEIARVVRCDSKQVDIAIAAAERAFPTWRNFLPAERGALLRKWAERMRDHAEDLATLLTCEQGKPLREARYEVGYAAAFLEWFAAEAERTYGETIPSHKPGSLVHTRLQPIGIVAVITPWNFPSAMITRKAAAALAVGCPVLVMPAPETPLSALALARIAQEVGIPEGVFQVITGNPAELSEQVLQDTRVRALSFTGSTPVGRLLLGQSAKTVKKVSLELGGHAPFLVFDDSPIELAVQGVMSAKFATSGQDCLAANRIYVQRRIYHQFVEACAAAVGQLKVGHGLDPTTDIGPMTKKSVADKCWTHIDDALSHGARLVAGGKTQPLGGNFVSPTLLADVSDDMLIAREETFGPVAAVLPFDSEDDVLDRANASEMGLAAYVYTGDLRRALRASERLEYGMVGVNTALFTGPSIPFGGWKQSGLGREGSRHGTSEFLEMKYVCLGDLAT
jgi:aspartate-semialdehyde dehydrogenase